MLRNLSFFCNSVYFIIFSCFCQYLKPLFIPVFHLSAHKKQGTPKTAFLIFIISFLQLCRLLIMHINEYPVSFSDIQWFSVEKNVFSALLKKHFQFSRCFLRFCLSSYIFASALLIYPSMIEPFSGTPQNAPRLASTL